MEKEAYKRQAALLINVIPEVAKENSVALHGGTAINLFVRDMPRLSVDIDLTYLPIEERDLSIANIAAALERIKTNIERTIPGVRVIHKNEIGKLQISVRGINVKLEVNLTIRGSLHAPVKMSLCNKAQNEFEAFCSINVIPLGQLYGGKICAALDRQHPRDLFDVKYLLADQGFTKDIKEGFLLCLLSSDRPMNEVLVPHFQDQRSAMENQFAGMSDDEFSYQEYEEVRKKLVKTIQESLTKEDKAFLLSVKNLTPDWSIYDFQNFPAVKWKLQNLQKLKEQNPVKHEQQYKDLKHKLDNFF